MGRTRADGLIQGTLDCQESKRHLFFLRDGAKYAYSPHLSQYTPSALIHSLCSNPTQLIVGQDMVYIFHLLYGRMHWIFSTKNCLWLWFRISWSFERKRTKSCRIGKFFVLSVLSFRPSIPPSARLSIWPSAPPRSLGHPARPEAQGLAG